MLAVLPCISILRIRIVELFPFSKKKKFGYEPRIRGHRQFFLEKKHSVLPNKCSGTHFFFWFPVWRSRRDSGSRRLCGRRRKPKLEPDVSRFVIVREIPNATLFRVSTFTRRTPPFHKMPNATPVGLSHRHACSEERSINFDPTTQHTAHHTTATQQNNTAQHITTQQHNTA